jgi:hypothetical protein
MLPSGQSSLALKGDEKSTFIISLSLYTFVLLPILIADRYNLDDWDRSLLGYVNWGRNGRPLTDVVMAALSMGKPLVDFSPICQIGAIICLSWLSAVIARKFGIGRPLIAALATLPLGANPFFLANLAFKFDSFPMVLSLLLALMPIVLDDQSAGHNYRSLFTGALFLLGSLCLYQPSINGFLVVAVLEYILLEKRHEDSTVITSLVRHRVFQLLIALCVYAVVAHFTVREGYGAEHASMVRGIGGLAIVQRNLVYFWSYPIDLLTGRLRLTLVMPVVVALLASIAVGLQYSTQTVKGGRFVWVIGAFVTPVFMLASSFILISTALTEYNVPGIWQCGLLFIPAYTMITFAAIYGNATKAQKDYEEHIAERLSDDVKEVIAANPVENLIIERDVGYAPLVRRMVQKRYRLLGDLVPIHLASDETGGFVHTVLAYHGISVPAETSKAREASIVAEALNSVPLRNDPYYKMVLLDHHLVVYLVSSAK